MDTIVTWILANKAWLSWLFGGAGVAVLGFLLRRFFFREPKDSQTINFGDGNEGIQNVGNNNTIKVKKNE